MSRLRVGAARVFALLRRRGLEENLDAEVQAHLGMLIEENVRRGMSLEDARPRRARSGTPDEQSALRRRASRFRDSGAIVCQQFRERAWSQTARSGTAGHKIAKLLELLGVQRAQTIVLPPGKEHGNLTLLPAGNDRLALRRIQKRREALLGVGCGNRKHIVYCRQNVHFRQSPGIVSQSRRRGLRALRGLCVKSFNTEITEEAQRAQRSLRRN